MIPRRFFWLFDLGVLGLAFLAAYRLVPLLQPWLARHGALQFPLIAALSPYALWTGQLPPLTSSLWMLLALAPTAILGLEIVGNYRNLLEQSRARIVLGGLVAGLAGVSLITLVLYAVRDLGWSRLFIFSFGLLSAAILTGYRLVLRMYYARRRAAGYYTKHVVLIGWPAGLERVVHLLARNPRAVEFRLWGWLQPAGEPASADRTQLDLPLLGAVHQLGDLIIHQPVHEVIAVLPSQGGDWVRQVIADCDYFRVGLRLVPEALLASRPRDLRVWYHAEPLHLPAIVLRPPHLDSDALFVKRLFDIAVSATLLVLLAPLLALIAIGIKLTTPHLPVLYPWRVVGHKGVEFTGYKFTTMEADADERKAELMSQNEMTGPVFKIKADPRITPLGHFLRKYSLNELPQLWSVLKGDMSLVGPRPAGPNELARYELWHKRKLSIRPGITCLWQVRGRNKISNFDDWVRMDLEYIDNWSMWLDLRILVRTAWVVLAGTGS